MTDNVTLSRNVGERMLAEHFNSRKAHLPGIAGERQTAFDEFSAKGLPNKRVEEFKYTDVRAALEEAAPLAVRLAEGDAKAALQDARFFAGIDATRVTLVDGYFAAALSDAAPAGVEVLPLAEALTKGSPLLKQLGTLAKAAANPLVQLNSAFMADGVIISVAKGVKLDMPLHLRFVAGTKAAATASRVLVLVEEGAELTLFESHESRDGLGFQLNDMIEFIVADNARVDHIRVNAEGSDVLAFSTLAARLGGHVSFSTVNVVFGARVARHQVYLAFEGAKSSAQVNGTALLSGVQHSDSTLIADHIAPGCDSRELFKTVIDDQATGVFQGRINVDAEAQKTDGKMMSACLLLSDGGSMYNKPELEIFADDVQCGHGATCGALDGELLFYLESRGLPRTEAESLLIQAFVGEAIEVVQHEGAREELIGHVSRWLSKRG